MPDLEALDFLTDEEREFLAELEEPGNTAENADEQTEPISDSSSSEEQGDSRPPDGQDADLQPEDASGEAGAAIPSPEGGEGEEPVLLAKDGKHTIPYSQLETERKLRLEYERRLQALEGTKPDPDPAPKTTTPDDEFADLKQMSKSELREYEQIADDDELDRIEKFRREESFAYARKRAQDEENNSQIQDFKTRHKVLFDEDPLVLQMLDGAFVALVQQGKPVKDALTEVEARMVRLGLLKADAAPEKLAQSLKSLESRSAPPRTLAAGGQAPRSAKMTDLDRMDLLEAEAIVGAMSREEVEKFLRM